MNITGEIPIYFEPNGLCQFQRIFCSAQKYIDENSVISRGNYGDLRIRAKNLLRDPKRTVAEVESQIALEAMPLLRVPKRDREEHAGDIALQVMSDVIAKMPERAREWTEANGENLDPHADDPLRPCSECGETIGRGAHQHTCDKCGKECCTACSHDGEKGAILCEDCHAEDS